MTMMMAMTTRARGTVGIHLNLNIAWISIVYVCSGCTKNGKTQNHAYMDIHIYGICLHVQFNINRIKRLGKNCKQYKAVSHWCDWFFSSFYGSELLLANFIIRVTKNKTVWHLCESVPCPSVNMVDWTEKKTKRTIKQNKRRHDQKKHGKTLVVAAIIRWLRHFIRSISMRSSTWHSWLSNSLS